MITSSLKKMFSGKVPASRRLQPSSVLRLETLEDRLVPSSYGFSSATGTVTINAQSLSGDSFTVLYDGHGNISVTDNTGGSFSHAGVNKIVVNGSYGNDVVRFALTGNLAQNLEVDAALGDGDDR